MIDKKDIEKLAKLSCIFIDQSELCKIESDMEHIGAFLETIGKVDFTNASQQETLTECPLREDVTCGSYDRVEMLLNAPFSKDGYILLRKSE